MVGNIRVSFIEREFLYQNRSKDGPRGFEPCIDKSGRVGHLIVPDRIIPSELLIHNQVEIPVNTQLDLAEIVGKDGEKWLRMFRDRLGSYFQEGSIPFSVETMDLTPSAHYARIHLCQRELGIDGAGLKRIKKYITDVFFEGRTPRDDDLDDHVRRILDWIGDAKSASHYARLDSVPSNACYCIFHPNEWDDSKGPDKGNWIWGMGASINIHNRKRKNGRVDADLEALNAERREYKRSNDRDSSIVSICSMPEDTKRRAYLLGVLNENDVSDYEPVQEWSTDENVVRDLLDVAGIGPEPVFDKDSARHHFREAFPCEFYLDIAHLSVAGGDNPLVIRIEYLPQHEEE